MTPACHTVQHTIGWGSSEGLVVEETPRFVLYSLVHLKHPDSTTMAGEAPDYTIKSEFTVADVVITFFTGFITVSK